MAKPYSTVRFLEYAPYQMKDDEEQFSGIIKFKLKVLTPLHVRSGEQFIDERNSIYYAFYKWNNQLAIPGSTFKGCIRTVAESVSHSCLSGKVKDGGKEYDTIVPKQEGIKKCIVCDIFGYKGGKSKLSIGQLLLESGTSYTELLPSFKNPHITQSMLEKDKLIGYKFYHHGKANIVEKGKVPCEAVKPGAIFSGKLHYKCMTKEEIQLLCYALGFTGDIALKIGYGKPAYYGSVQLVPEDSRYEEFACEYREHRDVGIQEAINELESILNYKYAKVKSEWNEDGTY